LSTWTT